jgi:hypothetical protein
MSFREQKSLDMCGVAVATMVQSFRKLERGSGEVSRLTNATRKTAKTLETTIEATLAPLRYPTFSSPVDASCVGTSLFLLVLA